MEIRAKRVYRRTRFWTLCTSATLVTIARGGEMGDLLMTDLEIL